MKRYNGYRSPFITRVQRTSLFIVAIMIAAMLLGLPWDTINSGDSIQVSVEVPGVAIRIDASEDVTDTELRSLFESAFKLTTLASREATKQVTTNERKNHEAIQ